MMVRSDATEHKSFGSEVYLIRLDAAEKLSLRKDISASSCRTPCLVGGDSSEMETVLSGLHFLLMFVWVAFLDFRQD